MRLPLRASYSISAFALLGAMGCGADAGPNVAEETGTATQELVTALPKRGGNGGTAWSTSYAREYLKFQARTGYYVDALAFTYALFDNSVLETGFYGGGGGTLSQNVYCPDGYIVGYFGTADSYLNSFSVICENMHVSPPGNRRNAVTYLPPNNAGAIGRPQGAPFREECPQGQVIKYFVIWSGAFVDAIQGFCGPRLS